MSELTRQERFSMSRQFAKELVADSIITDAAAQFLALMIEEIHNTKIAPLQAELKRRTTLSAAMELPEVKELMEAMERAIEAIDAAYDGPDDNGAYTVRERAALAAIKEKKL